MTYQPLQNVIPSYLYQEYSDDEDLQAFVAAFNELAQSYLDWFNDTPLAVYANPNVTGPLLDWIATGIYGISRPVFSAITTRFTAGLNAFPLNASAVNSSRYFQSGSATVATDDYYKRILTWWLYAGNGGNEWGGAGGRAFNVELLRLRCARFLYCANGGDFRPPVDAESGMPIYTEGGTPLLLDPATDPLSLAGTVHINPEFLAPPPAPVVSTGGGILSTDTLAPIVTNTGAEILVTGAGSGTTEYAIWETYVNQIGETTPSPPTVISLSPGQLLIVDSPPAANGAIKWNVYVAIQAPGPLRFLAGVNATAVNRFAVNGNNRHAQVPGELQNTKPILIGTGWNEPSSGLVTGRPLPTVNTTNRLANFIITVPNVPAAVYLQQAFVQGLLSFPFQYTAEVYIEAPVGPV